MRTIVFDERSSGWAHVADHVAMFLNMQIDYLLELAKHRGYLYLNQIHEVLGVAWDARDENTCWTDVNNLKIDYELVDNAFIIEVGY